MEIDEAKGADDLDISLRLKELLSNENVCYNPTQQVTISARALETAAGVPSMKKLVVDLKGGHVPYGNEGDTLSDSQKVVKKYIERREQEK